jgi:hypothetical protein
MGYFSSTAGLSLLIMPKTKERRRTAETRSPVEIARDSADAMFRAAVECCHQHDRVARIQSKSVSDEEVTGAQQLCAVCDEMLRALSDAYETTAAAIRPQRLEDDWWRLANTLWLASREYVRRNHCCDESSKEFKEHGPGRLGALHAEYELEASALLGLSQAAEAYRRARPVAE